MRETPLKDAHAALDAAVRAAYDFTNRTATVSDRSYSGLLKQLLDRNFSVAARIAGGELVISPGVPPNYGDPNPLITDG